MAIPNVKRFRPFCPTCNENFTLMAVLPKDADIDKYLADAVARHDHKAYQESKVLHFKVRVGQQKQKKAKYSGGRQRWSLACPLVYIRDCKVLTARSASWETSPSGSFCSFCNSGMLVLSPLRASTRHSHTFSSFVPPGSLV